MMFTPATLAASAVELHDDDGQPVATIYATLRGVHIVCQQGWTAEFTLDQKSLTTQLGVSFTPATEARRR